MDKPDAIDTPEHIIDKLLTKYGVDSKYENILKTEAVYALDRHYQTVIDRKVADKLNKIKQGIDKLDGMPVLIPNIKDGNGTRLLNEREVLELVNKETEQ